MWPQDRKDLQERQDFQDLQEKLVLEVRQDQPDHLAQQAHPAPPGKVADRVVELLQVILLEY